MSIWGMLTHVPRGVTLSDAAIFFYIHRISYRCLSYLSTNKPCGVGPMLAHCWPNRAIFPYAAIVKTFA